MSDGIAWYSNFGEQNLGRLDPKTGKVTEYPDARAQAGLPDRILALRTDQDGNLWLGNMYQATIVKFDRKTEKFRTGRCRTEQNIDAAQVNMVSPQSSHVDGKVWAQNNGFAGVHRLDLATGKIETWEPFKDRQGAAQHLRRDPGLARTTCTSPTSGSRHIGRIDAKTGEVKMYEMPTAGSAPRRGKMDAQDRLWFARISRRRIAMFDTKTEKFKEWRACRRHGRRPTTSRSTRTARPGPARC